MRVLRLVLGLGVLAAALALLSAIAGPSARANEADTTRIRVRILDRDAVRSARVAVETGQLQVHIPDHDAPIATLAPGDTARVTVRATDVALVQPSGGLYATSLQLRAAPDSVRWTLLPDAGPSRSYTGGLHVRPDTSQAEHLVMVNAVPLDDYVAGVVASEYPFDDVAGAKAMAVLVRTYALRAAAKFRGAYDHVDHTASQVYRGAAAVTPLTWRATQATEGQVAVHDGRPIEAVYFSSSGGHTADHEDVWDADRTLPYLRGRPDPYDEASPHHRWTTRINRQALLQGLSAQVGYPVQGFYLGDRADGRRLTHIELLRTDGSRTRIRANDFRLHVAEALPDAGLKSTWFDARREGDVYVFEGRGFGHGVGLSQWGAHAMAQAGHTYREILQFYYTDVAVQRLDGATLPPTPPLADEDPESDPPRRIGW